MDLEGCYNGFFDASSVTLLDCISLQFYFTLNRQDTGLLKSPSAFDNANIIFFNINVPLFVKYFLLSTINPFFHTSFATTFFIYLLSLIQNLYYYNNTLLTILSKEKGDCNPQSPFFSQFSTDPFYLGVNWA